MLKCKGNENRGNWDEERHNFGEFCFGKKGIGNRIKSDSISFSSCQENDYDIIDMTNH